MLKKVLLTASIFLFYTLSILAQGSGGLKVTLKDKTTGESIPFANVVVELNGVQAGGATTNFDGEAMIKPLNPGKYTVKASYVGYQPVNLEGVVVGSDKTAYAEIKMSAGSVNLNAVEIVQYSVPLINPDNVQGKTVGREAYQAMATKNISSVAATTAGVYQQDEGKDINVRGSRSESTTYYIDGIKVTGTSGVPQMGVEQVTTITGGLPAMYGDATGGIISITTRGPQNNFIGGVELISSQFLDAFGYNHVGFNLGGPILKKKEKDSDVKTSVLGFFISGEAISEKDADPSAIGVWQVNPEKTKELEAAPLRPSPTGTGFVRSAEFLKKDDMIKYKAKQNAGTRRLRLNGKIDYKPVANTVVTMGGSVDYYNQNAYIYEYALLTPVNNPLYTSNTWNVFGKITQRFGSQTATKEEQEKASSNIKNAYYTLQANYQKRTFTRADREHGKNIFDYGYVGKFEHLKGQTYSFQENGPLGAAYYQDGISNDAVRFTRAEVNPLAANYTQQIYDFIGAENIQNDQQIQQGQGLGLLNGDRPTNIYALWYNVGRRPNLYSNSDESQFRIFTNFSADIKDHNIQFGLEYEQRNERYFGVNPFDVWGLMRQLANSHISQLDTANPIYVPELSGTYDYYRYDRKYDGASQTQFDKSLREKLGKPVNGTEWIDTDSYDPSTFSLDMFSADDLLQNGTGPIGWDAGYNYGYDHTGKKLSGNPSLDDFFNKKDAKGNFTREVPAFQPIYIAGYIQDKFDFRDLKFNIGVRIDRFDANQQVLKDRFLLQEAKTAKEVNYSAFGTTKPSNISDDAVVYVNDPKSPTAILGYREGDVWYNASGTEISDPNLIKGSTGIAPYLVDPNQKETTNSKAFKDYDPQVNIMPRIAFSFPISDMANFFAHYDLTTQRPQSGNRLNPVQYLYLNNLASRVVSNPALKPERTTDYELGYSQVLNEKKNSAITLSAFYRELRDMIQVVRVTGAYPLDYLTYDNLDFGTVKGFSVAYDLRRTGGVQLSANYTLQFADGTGSSSTDGLNLANSGLPNLRTLVPLNFDQRHAIVLNFDYRFGSGADYRGPNWTKKKGDKEQTYQILSDFGFNIIMRAGSGTPYSRQSNVTQGDVNDQNVAIALSQRSALQGTVRGSRLPWQYKADLRIDKNFQVQWAKKEGGEGKKSNVNVYVQVLNLFNTRNVINAYRYTGNPGDDGYLAAASAQANIASQLDPQSFSDLYSLKVNDPSYYSMPRRIRLGVVLDF